MMTTPEERGRQVGEMPPGEATWVLCYLAGASPDAFDRAKAIYSQMMREDGADGATH